MLYEVAVLADGIVLYGIEATISTWKGLFPISGRYRFSFFASFHFRVKLIVASDACGYPDSPTRLLREVPQAPLEHRFSICGCAFL